MVHIILYASQDDSEKITFEENLQRQIPSHYFVFSAHFKSVHERNSNLIPCCMRGQSMAILTMQKYLAFAEISNSDLFAF